MRLMKYSANRVSTASPLPWWPRKPEWRQAPSIAISATRMTSSVNSIGTPSSSVIPWSWKACRQRRYRSNNFGGCGSTSTPSLSTNRTRSNANCSMKHPAGSGAGAGPGHPGRLGPAGSLLRTGDRTGPVYRPARSGTAGAEPGLCGKSGVSTPGSPIRTDARAAGSRDPGQLASHFDPLNIALISQEREFMKKWMSIMLLIALALFGSVIGFNLFKQR